MIVENFSTISQTISSGHQSKTRLEMTMHQELLCKKLVFIAFRKSFSKTFSRVHLFPAACFAGFSSFKWVPLKAPHPPQTEVLILPSFRKIPRFYNCFYRFKKKNLARHVNRKSLVSLAIKLNLKKIEWLVESAILITCKS